MRAARLAVFVRRGGPNYQAGLAAMRALGEESGLEVAVYGPESSMTGICKLAINHVGAAAEQLPGGGAAAEQAAA